MALITRSDASALIPEDVTAEIFQGVVEQSVVLSTFKRVTMSRKQKRMPVMNLLPNAYFVDGDTGMRRTTKIDWTNKYLEAEEVAVILPIPRNVIDDVDYDIWGESKPKLIEALSLTIDEAVFFGTGKPASWPTDIETAAIAAGNNITRNTTAANGGIHKDMSALMAEVEEDGYVPDTIIATPTLKKFLRQAYTSTGEKTGLDITQDNIFGIKPSYPKTGIWGTSSGDTEAFALDSQQHILGVRSDFDFETWTTGVIQDHVTGEILYNLNQQRMAAMIVWGRFAWQVPNPVNRMQPTEANRYPAAVLQAP